MNSDRFWNLLLKIRGKKKPTSGDLYRNKLDNTRYKIISNVGNGYKIKDTTTRNREFTSHNKWVKIAVAVGILEKV